MQGGRLGFINREHYIYPLVGAEAGIDMKLKDDWFIGICGTGDWREDRLFSGAEPSIEYSTHLRLGKSF